VRVRPRLARPSSMTARPRPEVPGPGQESVWAYPRPPAVERSPALVVVEFAGEIVAESDRTWRVLETSHPPVHYLPREDVRSRFLAANPTRTWCEFKGAASYADLVVGDRRSPRACWWYEEPTPGYEDLADAVTFYPRRVDRITVDGERVHGVDGDFYGGWITSRVVGPFKGGPGTEWW
jgi:uncharacterized protein (DUF427 family)